MGYKLMKVNGEEVKDIEAPYYTKALMVALEGLGYKVEAVDDEDVKLTPEQIKVRDKGVHLSHCYQGEYETTCKYGEDETCPAKSKVEEKQIGEVVGNVNNKVPPFTAKALEIFNLINKEPHTLVQLAEKTGCALSTVKTVVTYKFKVAGYTINQSANPGVEGILYSIRNW